MVPTRAPSPDTAEAKKEVAEHSEDAAPPAPAEEEAPASLPPEDSNGQRPAAQGAERVRVSMAEVLGYGDILAEEKKKDDASVEKADEEGQAATEVQGKRVEEHAAAEGVPGGSMKEKEATPGAAVGVAATEEVATRDGEHASEESKGAGEVVGQDVAPAGKGHGEIAADEEKGARHMAAPDITPGEHGEDEGQGALKETDVGKKKMVRDGAFEGKATGEDIPEGSKYTGGSAAQDGTPGEGEKDGGVPEGTACAEQIAGQNATSEKGEYAPEETTGDTEMVGQDAPSDEQGK
eukprot:gene11340-17814_t